MSVLLTHKETSARPGVSLSTLDVELTTTIHIDVSIIPDHVRDDLAAATLDFIRGILREPDGRERLDAKIAARRATR